MIYVDNKKVVKAEFQDLKNGEGFAFMESLYIKISDKEAFNVIKNTREDFYSRSSVYKRKVKVVFD